MGFPPGWVTDCNIPVSAMHRCIGNAVVVQVSEVVGRQLLAWIPQLETANVEVELA